MANNNTSENVKKIVDKVSKNAKPYVDELKTKAQPVIDNAQEKAAPYIDKMKTAAAPATKAIAKKSKEASKAAKYIGNEIIEGGSKYTQKDEVFIQYGNLEIRTTDIVAKAREDYISKGHKITDIKEIQVYIKPEDMSVYYVVNHTDTGKIEFK